MMQVYRGRKRRATTRSKSRSRSRSKSLVSRKVMENSLAMVQRGPAIAVPRSGLGNLIETKLVYAEKFSLTGGTLGTCGQYQFRTNSIFDPNLSGVGHQPLGYDQITPLFEKYVVTKMDYKINIVNGAASQAMMWCVNASDSTSTSGAIDQIIENGNARCGIISGYTGGSPTVKVTGTVLNWKLSGASYDEYVMDDVNGASVGANPTDVNVLNISVCDVATATGATVYALVELTYYTIFRGSVLTAQS